MSKADLLSLIQLCESPTTSLSEAVVLALSVTDGLIDQNTQERKLLLDIRKNLELAASSLPNRSAVLVSVKIARLDAETLAKYP